MPKSKKGFSAKREAKGFTLIELMIVIAIIAILTTIGISTYTNAQIFARDSRRKNDLKSIQTALELYYQKNSSYPTTTWVYSNASQPWIPGLTTTYINSVPTDPKSNGGLPYNGGSNFGYAYWASSDAGNCPTTTAGQYYILVTLLENQSDSERLGVKHQTYCSGQALDTTYSWSPYDYVITSTP